MINKLEMSIFITGHRATGKTESIEKLQTYAETLGFELVNKDHRVYSRDESYPTTEIIRLIVK